MLRKFVRVLAILFLTGSLVAGCIATTNWLTPSDEQRLYEEKYREAVEKLRQAEAAHGTLAEARLAKEARDAAESADLWGRGYRTRLWASRLGMLASGGVALLSLIILLLTFIKRKDKQAGTAPAPWSHSPPPNYGQPGLDSRPPQGW
jgi:hypothetical protein